MLDHQIGTEIYDLCFSAAINFRMNAEPLKYRFKCLLAEQLIDRYRSATVAQLPANNCGNGMIKGARGKLSDIFAFLCNERWHNSNTSREKRDRNDTFRMMNDWRFSKADFN